MKGDAYEYCDAPHVIGNQLYNCARLTGHVGDHVFDTISWKRDNGNQPITAGVDALCDVLGVDIDGIEQRCKKPKGHDGNHACYWQATDTRYAGDKSVRVEFGPAANPFHEALLANSRDLGPFLVKKNEAYGDAARRVTKVLELFFPNGIPVSRMEDAQYMTYIFNKLSRVAEDNDPMGEDPWLDACGYAMLAHCSKELKKGEKQ